MNYIYFNWRFLYAPVLQTTDARAGRRLDNKGRRRVLLTAPTVNTPLLQPLLSAAEVPTGLPDANPVPASRPQNPATATPSHFRATLTKVGARE